MSGEQFQTPIVKLKTHVQRDEENGLWIVDAAAPADLQAVGVGDAAWKEFFDGSPTNVAEATAMLEGQFEKFQKYVWSLELGQWPPERGISPIFRD
jgi:hypothetical protein